MIRYFMTKYLIIIKINLKAYRLKKLDLKVFKKKIVKTNLKTHN